MSKTKNIIELLQNILMKIILTIFVCKNRQDIDSDISSLYDAVIISSGAPEDKN